VNNKAPLLDEILFFHNWDKYNILLDQLPNEYLPSSLYLSPDVAIPFPDHLLA